MPGTSKRSTPSQPPEPSEGFVAVGWVRAPHGVRGELRVEPMTDRPTRFEPGSELWAGGDPYIVAQARPHRRTTLIVELEGVETRDDAEELRGLLLEVPESELEELEQDEFYRFNIVGMEVVDAEGRSLGRVTQIIETGANDVYVVESDEGELLIPAVDSVVRDVDVQRGHMVVELMEGLERRPPPGRKKGR